MKAVILAAGKSIRTYPLTLTKPKPLLKVAGRTLIEHNLDQLVDIIDEVAIIVGYKKDMIKKHLGNKFHKIKIQYIEQKEQLGTGHALLQAKKFIGKDKFICLMGDDLYFRGDIRKCIKFEYAILVKRVENYQDFGVLVKKGNRILDLIEKPKNFISDLANTALYVLNSNIFDILKTVEKSERDEIELTSAIRTLAKKFDIFAVEAKVWLPIAYPWNLLEADQILRDNDIIGKESKIKGKVSNSTIGKNCIIEGFVKNSLIGDNVKIKEDSVVEDSVFGDNVEFKGTVKTETKLEIKINNKINQVENFGCVIGDDSKLDQVLICPGSIIWNNKIISSKEIKGILK